MLNIGAHEWTRNRDLAHRHYCCHCTVGDTLPVKRRYSSLPILRLASGGAPSVQNERRRGGGRENWTRAITISPLDNILVSCSAQGLLAEYWDPGGGHLQFLRYHVLMLCFFGDLSCSVVCNFNVDIGVSTPPKSSSWTLQPFAPLVIQQ